MIVSDECQRCASSSTHMDMNSASASGVDLLVMYSKTSGSYSGQESTKFKKFLSLLVSYVDTKVTSKTTVTN